MVNQLLSLGVFCSLLLHGLVFLALCCSLSLPLSHTTPKQRIEKPETISLISLASFEQIEEKLKQKEEKRGDKEELHPKETLPEPQYEALKEKPSPHNDQENTPLSNPLHSLPEPTITEHTLPLKTSKPKKKKEKINPEEKIMLARNLLLKSKTTLTKTQTKTDFFRHAKSIAQQSIPETNKKTGDYSGKITGLGSLKFLSYEEKLRTSLLSSFNVIKHRFPIPSHTTKASGRASIDLIINKDGSIKQLSLVHSSGDSMFDKMIIESITYAAPFPPIPTHLGIESYRLGGMELHVDY